jgi:signal transduction histidine kinase
MPIDLPASEALDWVYEHAYMAECNEAMARMYGFAEGSELVGVPLRDLLPRTPENEAYLCTFFASGYKLRDAQSEERGKDGRALYFSNSLVGIVEEGRLLRAWGTQVNITEMKRTEMALVEADRRKDEFLATLAHELRNPLAPLVSGMGLMVNDIPLDPPEDAQIKGMMHRQLHHMVRLVDDLMDISRINRGKITLHRERVEIRPVLHMALESTRPLMDAAAHTLETVFAEEPHLVYADTARLVQVFSNLLSNAVKFTPRGGRICFTAQRKGQELVLQVQDNGIGLHAEHLASIFDMFSQVDSTMQRQQGGLGIGLALVKSLVEKHGGRVAAHSDGPGKGTTVTVHLPLDAEHGEGGAALAPSVDTHHAQPLSSPQ